jgi:prepilin-type N-terminal cleavage/methylation domain-containing protein
MNLLPSVQTQSRLAPVSAFTLVEMMVAMLVFVVLLVAAMIAVQIFTLRITNFTTDKLLATDGSCKAMDKICDQIRGANFLWVGTYTNNTFTPVANGSSQQGTALQVFSTTNSTPYYIYYLIPATAKLYSITNGESTSLNPGTLLASSITNNPCFWSENYQGTISTSTNTFTAGVNCTIRMRFQFQQYASPNANTRSEYYTIQTRATPRSPTLF